MEERSTIIQVVPKSDIVKVASQESNIPETTLTSSMDAFNHALNTKIIETRPNKPGDTVSLQGNEGYVHVTHVGKSVQRNSDGIEIERSSHYGVSMTPYNSIIDSANNDIELSEVPIDKSVDKAS